MPDEPTRAYTVEIPMRGVQTYTVYADNAEQALEAASRGERDQECDNFEIVKRLGRGTARRTPTMDR